MFLTCRRHRPALCRASGSQPPASAPEGPAVPQTTHPNNPKITNTTMEQGPGPKIPPKPPKKVSCKREPRDQGIRVGSVGGTVGGTVGDTSGDTVDGTVSGTGTNGDARRERTYRRCAERAQPGDTAQIQHIHNTVTAQSQHSHSTYHRCAERAPPGVDHHQCRTGDGVQVLDKRCVPKR